MRPIKNGKAKKKEPEPCSLLFRASSFPATKHKLALLVSVNMDMHRQTAQARQRDTCRDSVTSAVNKHAELC